jgi:flavin-dependent dehydrogenase
LRFNPLKGKGLVVESDVKTKLLGDLRMKYDVVIVGAGTAGCLAAKTAAEAGLKVCIVERKNRREIGEKVCGDALGEHHLRALGLNPPQQGEIERRIEGVKIYSPDLETVFTVRHEDFSGYLLNRRLFGQWLLNLALDEGAVLYDSMLCLEPIIEGGYVVGVSARDLRTGEKIQFEGKAVVDASGFFGGC